MLRKKNKILEGIWFERVPYTLPSRYEEEWNLEMSVCGMYGCKFSNVDPSKKSCARVLVRDKLLTNLCSKTTIHDPINSKYSYIPDRHRYILSDDEIKKIS